MISRSCRDWWYSCRYIVGRSIYDLLSEHICSKPIRLILHGFTTWARYSHPCKVGAIQPTSWRHIFSCRLLWSYGQMCYGSFINLRMRSSSPSNFDPFTIVKRGEAVWRDSRNPLSKWESAWTVQDNCKAVLQGPTCKQALEYEYARCRVSWGRGMLGIGP